MKNVRPYHKYARVSRNPSYEMWKTMAKTAARLKRDRGIILTICDRWKDFKNFVDDMGERPEGRVLSRCRYFEGFSPENCYWAIKRETVICLRPEYRDYMIGKTFGNWEVLSFSSCLRRIRYYICRCTRCKMEKCVSGHRLRRATGGVRCYGCIPYNKDRRA